MKTNSKYEVIARIARQSLELAALLAMVLSTANISRAQSSATSPATQAAQPVAVSAKAPVLPAAKPAAKGSHEGITVHGHWIIEVKNPDGKVTARREFENAIQPTGMSYLASLLAGNNAPGGLSIVLNGGTTIWDPPPQPLFQGFGSEPGPCLQVTNPFGATAVGGQPTGTACLITAGANASGYASELGSICIYSQKQAAQQNQPSPCSTNLMASAPTLQPFNAGNDGAGLSAQISLTGSVGVSSLNPGNVTDVETVFGACDGNSTPVNCLSASQLNGVFGVQPAPGANPVVVNVFTMRKLDSIGTDPQQVPYGPGQTIAVTVTISFQ